MAKIARPEIEIEELTGEGSGILKKNALLYGKELENTAECIQKLLCQKAVILLFMYMKRTETYIF